MEDDDNVSSYKNQAQYVLFKSILAKCSFFVVITKMVLFIFLWISVKNTNPSSVCCGWVDINSYEKYMFAGNPSNRKYNSECSTKNINTFGFNYTNIHNISICMVNNIVCDRNGDLYISDCTTIEYECPSYDSAGKTTHYSNFNFALIFFGIEAIMSLIFNFLSTFVDAFLKKTKEKFENSLIKRKGFHCCFVSCRCCPCSDKCGVKCQRFYIKLAYYYWQLISWVFGFGYNLFSADLYKYGVANLQWHPCQSDGSWNVGYQTLGNYSAWYDSNKTITGVSDALVYIGISIAGINIMSIVMTECCCKKQEKNNGQLQWEKDDANL